MLQNIRENAQGTIAKIIIGVLIVSLSIWGMDAIIGGFSGEPEVATVNGEDITEREFLRIVQIESQRRLAQMERPDPTLLDDEQIRREVLESLIQERVLTQDAVDQGLALSDADVDALITQMPQFQVDGQFNRDRFVSTVRNLGMGVAEFREAMRKQYVINQIRSGISQSGFVAESGAEKLLSLQNQTRDFRTVTLSAGDVANQVEVTAEEVAEYYESNAALFMRPETVDVQYIALSLESQADPESVTQEELEALYETRAEELAAEERRTAHILIEDGENAEATPAEVQEKLAAGEDFAELAETYSADVATASNGGDLGFAGRNLFDPAYEEAMFALTVGEVSEPVKTQFGTHLIKLLDVRETEVPSLAELEDELRTELAMTKADEAYAAARTELSNVAYESDDLVAPAEALGLEIHERSGLTRDGGAAPFDHAGLVRQLYSEDVLEDAYNTEVIDVGDNVSVVARVKEHHPARQLPLEEVEADIRAALSEEKTRDALRAEAESVVAALESGSELAEIDTVSGDWQSFVDQERNSAEVSPAVMGAVFALPRPEAEAPVYGQAMAGASMVIIALDKVGEGEVEDDSAEVNQLRRFMATLQGQREYTAYQQFLREQAEVERP